MRGGQEGDSEAPASPFVYIMKKGRQISAERARARHEFVGVAADELWQVEQRRLAEAGSPHHALTQQGHYRHAHPKCVQAGGVTAIRYAVETDVDTCVRFQVVETLLATHDLDPLLRDAVGLEARADEGFGAKSARSVCSRSRMKSPRMSSVDFSFAAAAG